MHTVIVGNGIAGNAVAFHIKKLNQQAEVTVISSEDCQAYDPGSLPYFVSGDVPRSTVILKTAEAYSSQNIKLILGKKVVALNPERKTISFENGEEMAYDNLVIATGGNPVKPPFPGIDKVGVLGCKSLVDADQLANHQGKSAVVIGSGLIGIEACEALKKKGYEVSLVELMGWIMPRVFDKEPADQLAAALMRNGINVFTNEKVLSIEGGSSVQGVTTDKRTISCDTVVMAVGVAPASQFAAEAGIEIGRTKGIKVNEKMLSSIPCIYACGDCVESWDAFDGESALYQLRHNALEQGEVIAKNCCGIQTEYRGAWSFTRVHYFDTFAISLGKTLGSFKDDDDLQVIDKSSADGSSRLIIKNGLLMGAQLIGKPAARAGFLLGAMWRKENFDNLKNNWEKVTQFNSPHPWNYRLLGQYMNLEQIK